MSSSTLPKPRFGARSAATKKKKPEESKKKALDSRDQTIIEVVKILHDSLPPNYGDIWNIFEKTHAGKACVQAYWPVLKARLDADMASANDQTRGHGPEWQLAIALAKRYRYELMVSQLKRIYVSRLDGEHSYRHELGILSNLETHD